MFSSLFFHFYPAQSPSQWNATPIHLSSPATPLWKHPHRHLHGCVSWVIPNPGWLTLMNSHTPLLYNTMTRLRSQWSQHKFPWLLGHSGLSLSHPGLPANVCPFRHPAPHLGSLREKQNLKNSWQHLVFSLEVSGPLVLHLPQYTFVCSFIDLSCGAYLVEYYIYMRHTYTYDCCTFSGAEGGLAWLFPSHF